MFDEHLRVPEIRAKSQPALEMNEVVWEAAQVGLLPSREAVGRMAEKTTLEGKILEGNVPTILPMPNTLEETFQIDPADIPGNPWSWNGGSTLQEASKRPETSELPEVQEH